MITPTTPTIPATPDALPPPVDIGLPPKFTSWRPGQSQAVLWALENPRRLLVQNQPTGAGKSATVVSQALLSGARTVVLTSTKALQEQYVREFADCGMVEVRGLNSYECVEARPDGRFHDARRGPLNPVGGHGYGQRARLPLTCDEAPCQGGIACNKRDGGCLHYDAVRLARNKDSMLVVTNYSYWFHVNEYGEGLGAFDLMVCDEAHHAVDELGRFISISLTREDAEQVVGSRFLSSGVKHDEWRQWGSHHAARIKEEIEKTLTEMKAGDGEDDRTGQIVPLKMIQRVKELKRVVRKLEGIAAIRTDWVIDHLKDGRGRETVQFDPVWPAPFAEGKLFRGIPKVVLVSATVRPKTASMLGVASEQVAFMEQPSSFPAARRPLIWIPTGQTRHNTNEELLIKWVKRMDQIIGRRQDRKGIIHTKSYARAAFIAKHSQFSSRFVLHDSTNTRAKIEEFRHASPPRVLVSPSVTTGVDFPYEDCEYVITSKVPFPDATNRVMKARAKDDPSYSMYLTMIELVQAAGRGMRAADDQCETFIIDDNYEWFMSKWGRQFAPKWLIEALVTHSFPQDPAPKLRRRR